jgi:hypothetical protein
LACVHSLNTFLFYSSLRSCTYAGVSFLHSSASSLDQPSSSVHPLQLNTVSSYIPISANGPQHCMIIGPRDARPTPIGEARSSPACRPAWDWLFISQNCFVFYCLLGVWALGVTLPQRAFRDGKGKAAEGDESSQALINWAAERACQQLTAVRRSRGDLLTGLRFACIIRTCDDLA